MLLPLRFAIAHLRASIAEHPSGVLVDDAKSLYTQCATSFRVLKYPISIDDALLEFVGVGRKCVFKHIFDFLRACRV